MRRNYFLALIISVMLMGCPHQAADKKSNDAKKHLGEDGYQCKVTKVIDGDTLHCKGVDGKHVVRLIGVDAPENGMPFYYESRNELKELTPVGASITLNFEKGSKTGQYNRILAYVFIHKTTDVNLQLIKSGWAETMRKYPFTRSEEFETAELEAKKAGRGMWKAIVCVSASGKGKRYHHCDCHHLEGYPKKPYTVSNAALLGYTPCVEYSKKKK